MFVVGSVLSHLTFQGLSPTLTNPQYLLTQCDLTCRCNVWSRPYWWMSTVGNLAIHRFLDIPSSHGSQVTSMDPDRTTGYRRPITCNVRQLAPQVPSSDAAFTRSRDRLQNVGWHNDQNLTSEVDEDAALPTLGHLLVVEYLKKNLAELVPLGCHDVGRQLRQLLGVHLVQAQQRCGILDDHMVPALLQTWSHDIGTVTYMITSYQQCYDRLVLTLWQSWSYVTGTSINMITWHWHFYRYDRLVLTL